MLEIVRRQVDLGITMVGDGEMSKPSYVSYVTQRLAGFGGSAVGPGTADLADYPEFAKQQVGMKEENNDKMVLLDSYRCSDPTQF